jgi:hypothetical protein
MSHDVKLPEWYARKRLMVDDAFKIGKPKTRKSKTLVSPMDRYFIEIVPFKIGENTWDYCEATIFKANTRDKIETVRRNYGNIPVEWCEKHLYTGDDYVVTGEDYQGLTVINLSKGTKTDWISENAREGLGFCMAEAFISPDHSVIAVHGCYWGAPYEIQFFDFNHPEKLPWKSLGNFNGFIPVDGHTQAVDEIICWDDDETLLATVVSYHHGTNKTPIEEIEDEEFDWLWEDPEERILVSTISIAIKPTGSYQIIDRDWSAYDSTID